MLNWPWSLGLILQLWQPLEAYWPWSTTFSEERAFKKQHEGETVELRSSYDVLPFFDENELSWLAHSCAYGANATSQEVVTAGSRWIVHDITFPTWWNRLSRVHSTPVERIWVVLYPQAALRGGTSSYPFVWVWPHTEDRGHGALEATWSQYFTKPGTVSSWLALRDAGIRTAIAHGRATLGMSQEDLVTAIGYPSAKTGDVAQSAKWYYARCGFVVRFEHHEVVDIRAL